MCLTWLFVLPAAGIGSLSNAPLRSLVICFVYGILAWMFLFFASIGAHLGGF
jgi:hypothetical protein